MHTGADIHSFMCHYLFDTRLKITSGLSSDRLVIAGMMSNYKILELQILETEFMISYIQNGLFSVFLCGFLIPD